MKIKFILKKAFLEAARNNHLRIKLLIIFFRIGSYLDNDGKPKIFGRIFRVIYSFYSKVICSIEIPIGTKIGDGLRIFHGFCIVINKDAVIGDNFLIRHGVTVGNILNRDGTFRKNHDEKTCPIIGNNVEMGCMSSIIGPVYIGDNARIGAGVVVRASMSSGETKI